MSSLTLTKQHMQNNLALLRIPFQLIAIVLPKHTNLTQGGLDARHPTKSLTYNRNRIEKQ